MDVVEVRQKKIKLEEEMGRLLADFQKEADVSIWNIHLGVGLTIQLDVVI